MLDLAQFYFPFTSIDGDRRYNAKDFATYFHSIFTDGVIATVKDKLRVSQSEATGMHVVVNTGAAFIHGHLYLLGEPLTVDVTPGNSTGDRVDSIVLQLDHLERDMKILYKQNSTNVQRDENYWELQIATINVPRNATQVLNSQINDKRANESVAGYSKLQGNLDVEGMEQHYESLLQQLTSEMTNWVTGKKADFQEDIDDWLETTRGTLGQLVTDMENWTTGKQVDFQTNWDTWFSTVRDALDGDTAGSLLNLITQLQTDLGNIDAPTTQEFEELQTDLSEHQADEAAHGIGDRANLETNEKGTIVGAMNELFTNVSDGKSLVGGAITGVDDSVVIPAEPTFNDLASAIGGISTGKKWASGSARSSSNLKILPYYRGTQATGVYPLEVSGLSFRPSIIFASVEYYSGGYMRNYSTLYINNRYYVQSGYVDRGSGGDVLGISSDFPISSKGFVLPVKDAPATFNWIAIE